MPTTARSAKLHVTGCLPSSESVHRYGSRTPEESVREALDDAEAVIVGIPGQSVADFARDHADELAGKVVIDAANKFGEGPAHSAAEFAVLAPAARYARAFNALGWENSATTPSSTASWPTSSTPPTRPTARPSNASSATPASTPSTSARASTTCSTNSSSSGSPLPTARGRGRHLAFKVL